MQDPSIDLYIDADVRDEERARTLRQHLRAAGFRGPIRGRQDVPPGEERARVVEHWLRTARVVVLLWSAEALASVEGQRALELACERDMSSVFPVLARACDCPRASFVHFFPRDGVALSVQTDPDSALLEIARALVPLLASPKRTDWLVVDANEPNGEVRRIPHPNDAAPDDALAALVDSLSGPAEQPWSAVDDDDDEEELQGRRADMARQNRPDRWLKLSERWIIARGEEELRVKRTRMEAQRTRREPLRGWDGRELDAAALAPWRLRRDHEAESTPGAGRGRDDPIPYLHDDELLAALYGLATASSRLRGVVILGAPGTGKSLLSRVAERRFLGGPLSALGLAVRRSARDLAADAADSPGASLLDLLARRGGDHRLFGELAKQRRLFLILDGLDEIGARALRSLAALLHQADLPFVATSREIPHGLDPLPLHARFRIELLRREDALRVLRAWDRHDLAEVMESRIPHSDHDLRSSSDAIAVLCRTPFHLALLCRAIRRGEAIPPDGESDLYRRVFEGLLDQAVEDRRLHDEQAEVLRRQGHVLAGNLAIVWLRSETGRLTEIEVSAALESAGLAGKDVLEVQRALEFGYLIAPGADNVEFSHRTIGEWVAARALAHRVRATLQRAAQAGKPLDAAARADLEERELAPFLKVEERGVRPASWPLLRFYMPEAAAPLAVVRRFLGRRMFEVEKFNIVEESFSAAFELASLARWPDGDAARTAWGLFVRAATFAAGEPRYSPPVLAGAPAAWKTAFAERVAAHLPRALPDLVSLAARTEAQADRFRADPTLFVQLCPRGHLQLFEDLLRCGTPQQKLRIVQQYLGYREDLPYEVERQWPVDLPDQIEKAADHDERRALEEIESGVYEALIGSSREIPWNALRRRILDWPYHLRQALIRWFCLPERRETVYGFASAGPTSTALSMDALSILIADLGTRRAALLCQLREAAAAPDAPKLARDLQRKIERDEEVDDPWPRFVAVAREAGWVLGRGFSSYGESPHVQAEPLSAAFAGYDERRKQVHALLGALGGAGRLDAVAGPLWQLLSPADEQRAVLFEGFLAARSIPACVPVKEVLEYFEGAEHLPYELTSQNMFAPVHEERLRELARSGEGWLRFVALLWCARRNERDETGEMVACLAVADPELQALASRWVQSRGRGRGTKTATALPPESLTMVPLAYRAEADDPGWRADLLEALGAASRERYHELCALVRRHRVREALPVLVRRFRGPPVQVLADAIAAILEPEDREAIDLLLSTEARHLSLPKRVLSSLTLADLPRLLSRLEPPGAAFARRGGARSLARFGAGAHSVLVDAFRQRSEAAKEEAASKEAGRGSRVNAGWVDALRRAALETIDVESMLMEKIGALLFELFGGDRHDVSSSPGPLGSDFDEPYDLVYESSLRHSSELSLAIEILKRRLALHPDEAPAASRLLDHPSETLQLGVFEVLASAAEPHEVAVLAVRALEGHLRSTDTDLAGETAGLYVASVTPGGSGSINIRRPEVGKKLAAAVRRHLTGAHRPMLAELVKHKQAVLRQLACRWIGEIGTAAWAPLLTPALADGSAPVVMAALRAWTLLHRASLAPALASTLRRRWSARHYEFVLAWLARKESSMMDFEPPMPRRADEILPVDQVTTLVGEALDAFPVWDEPPAALETLLTTLGEGPHTADASPLSSSSLRARAAHVGPEMRAVLVRTLARRGGEALPDDMAAGLSAASLDDRLTAAEALAMTGRVGLATQIIDVWNGAFQNPSNHRASDLRLRLARMLEEASAVFAPLWLHLLDDLSTNWEGDWEEPGEQLLRAAERCLDRWGPTGLENLLDVVPSHPLRWEPHGAHFRSLTDVVGADTIRRLLRTRAPQHPAFAALAEELPEDRDEASAKLEHFVAFEVLPEGWWAA